MDLPAVEVLEEWARVAESAALEAGNLIKEQLSKPKELYSKSSNIDLVTETDRKCEEIIIGEITKRYPTHNIIAEESFAASGASGYQFSDSVPNWVIDPIDGTNNFVHGYPFSCVCVGVSIGKIPVVGVVYNPAGGETFRAIIGQGAFMNGERISVSTNVSTLNAAALGTEFGYARDIADVDVVLKRLRNLLLVKTQTIRCAGSAALNMCNVATGRLDLYFEGLNSKQGPKPWDVIAAAVIVTEAGGVLRDLDGSPFDPCCGRILAVNSVELANELISVIHKE